MDNFSRNVQQRYLNISCNHNRGKYRDTHTKRKNSTEDGRHDILRKFAHINWDTIQNAIIDKCPPLSLRQFTLDAEVVDNWMFCNCLIQINLIKAVSSWMIQQTSYQSRD
ncbi:hypothetical protein FGO68_gene6580 [Halteria grandinella]|uniref:Uncharacterized protein n=1 Tax=Halteria grandinella TaxID=5974 RepID=A0A8J8SVA2_HALGN|nr:hypothetical protein FGO68_gene6580 [Halteria grandinella]